MPKISENEKTLIAVLVIIAVIGFVYVKSINKEIKNGEELAQEISKYEESIKPFYDLALTAKGFAIYNIDTKQFLYKKGAEEAMPLASLAKVMSVVVALETLPQDHVFEISKESLSQVGDNGLLLNEKWQRDDLLRYLLVTSSNDAIHEVALETGRVIDPESSDPVKTFVDRLNEKAKEMNLRTFIFNNESGLDIDGSEDGALSQNGAYASARDMARLFAYAVDTYPDIFSATTEKEFKTASLDSEHAGENTNPLVPDIPGLLASKTGFTNMSGGNLVVALKDGSGDRMVVVVLGSTFDDRFSDIKALSGVLNSKE